MANKKQTWKFTEEEMSIIEDALQHSINMFEDRDNKNLISKEQLDKIVDLHFRIMSRHGG